MEFMVATALQLSDAFLLIVTVILQTNGTSSLRILDLIESARLILDEYLDAYCPPEGLILLV